MFHNVSKIVSSDKCDTFASLSTNESRFSWQGPAARAARFIRRDIDFDVTNFEIHGKICMKKLIL